MLLPNGEQSFLEQNHLLRLLFQSPGHHKGEVGAHLRYVKEAEVVARVVFPGGGSHPQRQACQQPGKPCSTHLNFTRMRVLLQRCYSPYSLGIFEGSKDYRLHKSVVFITSSLLYRIQMRADNMFNRPIVTSWRFAKFLKALLVGQVHYLQDVKGWDLSLHAKYTLK
jgi:hypothetical protein